MKQIDLPRVRESIQKADELFDQIRETYGLVDGMKPSNLLHDETEYVYFLHDQFIHPELIKIGYSSNPISRFKNYVTVLPAPKFIAIAPGSRSLEKFLHSWLTKGPSNRHAFGEWFHLDQSEIQEVINQHNFVEVDPINYPIVFL